jgi:hypothetical protein
LKIENYAALMRSAFFVICLQEGFATRSVRAADFDNL